MKGAAYKPAHIERKIERKLSREVYYVKHREIALDYYESLADALNKLGYSDKYIAQKCNPPLHSKTVANVRMQATNPWLSTYVILKQFVE